MYTVCMYVCTVCILYKRRGRWSESSSSLNVELLYVYSMYVCMYVLYVYCINDVVVGANHRR